MRQRTFHLRSDLDISANLRRLFAHIRSLQPNYQPGPKLKVRAQMRATLKRVK